MKCPNCGCEDLIFLSHDIFDEVDLYECEDCGEIFEDEYGEGDE